MAAKSKHRGHDIEYNGTDWIYSDTKQVVSDNKNRSCFKCGEDQTKEGHDACLGTLPGVKNACCGHGDSGAAYIQFIDGHCIRGKDAMAIIEILKRYKLETKTV